METQPILKQLETLRSAKHREGMARFGINTKKTFGVSVAELRKHTSEKVRVKLL